MSGRGGSGSGGRNRTTVAGVLAHIASGGGLHAVLTRDGAFRSDGLPRAGQVLGATHIPHRTAGQPKPGEGTRRRNRSRLGGA